MRRLHCPDHRCAVVAPQRGVAQAYRRAEGDQHPRRLPQLPEREGRTPARVVQGATRACRAEPNEEDGGEIVEESQASFLSIAAAVAAGKERLMSMDAVELQR